MADKSIVQKEVDVIQKARGFWANYNKPVIYIGCCNNYSAGWMACLQIHVQIAKRRKSQ